MARAKKTRVLIVCGGNTCRSPVLSILLQAELRRTGQDDVEVLSGAADDSLAPFGYRMNEFAIEALREVLAKYDNAYRDDLFREAREHTSTGLGSFCNQVFDLVVFVHSDCADGFDLRGITADEKLTGEISDEDTRHGKMRVSHPR